MKSLPFIFLLCIPSFLWAQTIDTTAIEAEVDSLIQISKTLTGKGDYDKALEVNAEAEKIALEMLGKESAAYGSTCFNRGRIASFKGDSPEAEKWYLESKAIREKVLGKGHPDYAGSLNNLGLLYSSMGQYEKAEKLYLESMAIREKALGMVHSDYAGSLINLGILYRKMADYDQAESLFLEAKEIFETGLNNREHPGYMNCLNSLASLYMITGNYEEAEPLYLEAKAIRGKVLGKEHHRYAFSLSTLAILYKRMGQYEKAEPLYLEALAIFEKTVGKEHQYYAGTLMNLAILYYEMGNYEKTEALFLESKTITAENQGIEHPDYAEILNNLAGLYYTMGNYEKAEPLYLESLAIREKSLGREHPNNVDVLTNLGSLYKDMGNYEKAESLMHEALAINEKALGKENPVYADILSQLGLLHMDMGNYEIAENFHLESKAIREKVLGKEHPFYAESLNNLAILYSERGSYEKAEELFLESKAIKEKVLGKENPVYTENLSNLAEVYSRMGQYEKAGLYFDEAASLTQLLIRRAIHHLSESELNDYLKNFIESHDAAYASTQNWNRLENAAYTGNSLSEVCYDNSLFYKGFLLNAASQIKRLALTDSTTTEKFNLLKSYERRLAAQYAMPIAERDSAGVIELEEKSNNLEKELARTVAGYGEAIQQVKWQEVQQKLEADEAAVEFVQYHYHDKKQTDSTMYAALLLRPGDTQPRFIPLFEEKSLDSLLQTQGERKSDYVNNLYTIADRGARPIGQPQKSLYELLWQPLEKSLPPAPSNGGGEQPTIYFSPSGLLHRLNLGAVPIPPSLGGGQGEAEETLADRYRLVEMGSTRQLVVPADVKVAAQDAVLYGGVQFEMDSTAITSANIDYNTGTFASRGELSFSATDSTSRGGTWNYLSWTEKEIAALEPILKNAGIKTNSRKGFAATEESFKSIGLSAPSPRILHIATHGFFFPDPKDRNEGRVMRDDEPVFKMSDHPMIRSGLILAGGNYAWQTGKPIKPDMDDGILTAYEISQMNLSNTELVVLSACETGLGDIRGNEGVYGLQRAFKIAGAKYLIMSLWQVPDQETSVFMTTFYRHFIEEKMAIPDAFRTTQQEMRERFINPYQWAGFVLVE